MLKRVKKHCYLKRSGWRSRYKGRNLISSLLRQNVHSQIIKLSSFKKKKKKETLQLSRCERDSPATRGNLSSALWRVSTFPDNTRKGIFFNETLKNNIIMSCRVCVRRARENNSVPDASTRFSAPFIFVSDLHG